MIDNIIFGFKEQLPALAPKIYMGCMILLIFWIVAVVVERIIRWLGHKSHIHKDILFLLGRTLRTTLVIFGLISALGTMGINVSALVASLGLTGFALGFALKDALSNLLAGVLVLVYRPLKIGDKIIVTGFEGTVVQIDLRYTTLKTEGRTILIPNANLFNNPVVILNK